MAQKYDDSEGVWRTIGGRKVFIRNGQSLSEAMIESGKFKNLRSSYKKAKEEDSKSAKELDEELRKKEDKYLSSDKGVSEKEKEQKEIKDLHDKLKEKAKEEGLDTEKTNWRDEIAKNKEQLEKDLKEYQDTHDMSRENEGYYELFRENERKNAKIKQEEPNEKYEFVESYATYKDKRDKLEGIERDAYGNVDWDKVKDATWTGKEYTNDEFLENLEDENWHTERKMLLDAGLTNKQMEFVKDHTTFHNGSPSLDKEITEELIKGAKGEKYKTPEEIKENRNALELEGIKRELDIVSQNGRYDENGNTREEIHGFRDYNDLKERYKTLTGKEYDDSKVEIPYDPNKEYKYPNGTIINQDLMKERYSGENPEKVKRDIDFNKSYLMNYNPKDRELHNAEIKEMEKYYDSMEKYESRISDDYSIKDKKNAYTSNAWEGSNYDPNMTTTEISKAVADKMKEAYPGVKISRKSSYYSGGSSAHFNIMESDKPIIRSIDDFSDAEIEKLYNSGYNQNYYKTKEDFKESLRKDLESGHLNINQYNVSDDYRLTPYGKAVIKDMNKVIDSYNFDDSDGQIDYFHTNFYNSISIGKSDKPYKTTEPKTTNDDFKRDRLKYVQDKDKEMLETYNKAKDSGFDNETATKVALKDAQNKSTNETMNKAIREGANKYKGTKHIGFGDYNDANIPVYDNKIDYTGDFGRNADLSTLSNKELQEAIKVQTSELEKANSERLGDQRTRNGKMDKIFNTARKQQYSEGVKLLKEEYIRRENEKYPDYDKQGYGVKYYSVEDASKDPNSAMNQYIKNQAEKKAYNKYLKQHPGSNISLEDFKKSRKK